MPWSWGVYPARDIITLFIILELLQRRRELGYEPVVRPKAPHPLKPRAPLDCPVCGPPHPKSLWSHAHHSGGEPWH